MPMRRREFIVGLGGAAAWPGAVLGQQLNQARRIGVLMQGSETEPDYRSYLAAFVQGLRQLGWIEGQSLRIDVRWSAGDAKLARANSAELIGLMPDVILAATTLNLTMIHEATSTVPVVFVAVADPVKQGFVASIRQPAGNLPGSACSNSLSVVNGFTYSRTLCPTLCGSPSCSIPTRLLKPNSLWQ